MKQWIVGFQKILTVVSALVAGVISLIAIRSSRMAERDKMKKQELEQQLKTQLEIREAIKSAPTNKEGALNYLKKRKGQKT